jgi:TRAP-type C4-dicarboxylate transport system permease small subunit
VARKAVDSTLRRILNYTTEIIMSIILLVIICIPLVFVIPMWFQTIAFGLPRNELALDPVRWVGTDGAFWITLLLGLVSFMISYIYILRLKPGTTIQDDLEDDESEEAEEEGEFLVNEEVEEVEEVLEEEVEALLEEEAEELTTDDVDDNEAEFEDED